MDYGRLVGDAWRTTLRNRYLWGLALFAGGAVGVGTRDAGPRIMPGRQAGWIGDRAGDATAAGGAGPLGALRQGDWRLEAASERAQAVIQEAAQWAVANAGLVIVGAVLVALLAVALLALGLIARGGMAEATVDLATGQTSSLRRMWRAGTRLAWRYAGLWLLLAAVALVVGALVGGLVAAGVGAATATGMPRVVWGLGALVAIPAALMAAVAAIALAITVAYAERAIYAEDAGPIDALKAGWRVLRANLGTSALLWLVNLALSIGIGVVIALGAMLLVGVLGGTGAALWFTTGWSAPLVAYGALGVAAVASALLLAGAVVNTFFWNYWSLAYVRLTGAARA